MRIVQRYLLLDLLGNAALTLVALLAMLAMVLFSISTLKSGLADLDVHAILQIVLYLCVPSLVVVIPLAIMIACLTTYGRAAVTGELDAMRGAGIRLAHLLLPAAALGAAGTFALAWLGDTAIPQSHYRQMEVGQRLLLDNLGVVFQSPTRRIEDDNFVCRWEEVGREDGRIVLRDVMIAQLPEDGARPVVTRARRALPHFDARTRRLALELEGITHGDLLASESLTVELDLGAVVGDGPPSRRPENLAYEELITRARRAELEVRRESLTELNRRAASSASALVFAIFAATLGIVLRLSNRAVVFGIGFVAVLLLGHAPTLIAASLSKAGSAGAVLPLWIGDWILTIGAVLLFLKALRR